MKKNFRWIGIFLIFLFAVVLWLRRTDHQGPDGLSQTKEPVIAASVIAPASSDDLNAKDAAAGTSIAAPSTESESRNYKRWSSIARKSYLHLVDADGLELNSAVVDLLELDEQQTNVLKNAIRGFVDGLKAEELRNAYVKTDASGNEEIVVAPFDREPLRSALKADLSKSFDAEIVQFIDELTTYDGSLRFTGSEMRLAYEEGPEGMTNVVINAQSRSRRADPGQDTYFHDGIRFSANQNIRTVYPSSNGVGPRYSHLFQNVSSFPRRTGELTLDSE